MYFEMLKQLFWKLYFREKNHKITLRSLSPKNVLCDLVCIKFVLKLIIHQINILLKYF